VGDQEIRPRADRRGRALGRLLAGGATLLLIVSACGGGAASPSATATPPAAQEATPATSTSPEATSSPLETPQPTQVAGGDCTPAGPTEMSLNWVTQQSLSGDYRFERPADWADLSATLTLPTNVSVSPETFAETGLAADARQKVDAVRSFDAATLVTAWVIEGVTTPTDELFPRELAWLKTQPQIKEVLGDQLATCIGGHTARGFASTWATPSGDTNFVIFVLQRNGKMYEVQLTAKDPAQEMTFVEILNSWEFIEPVDQPTDLDDQFAATAFKVVGVSSVLDKSIKGQPNPATFQSAFPSMSERIYVIYDLDDGVQDTVHFSWTRDGRELGKPSQFDFKTTSYAWGWIEAGADGLFDTGSYAVTLSLEGSGDTITVPFTVE
jgi:hypothetical protein